MDPSWSDLYRCRRRANERWPSVYTLPRVRRAARLAAPWLREGIRILEVGPGAHPRAPALAAGWAGAEVTTVDPDPAAGQRHTSLDEIEGPFDLALVLEVIEHLPLAGALDLLREIRDRLAPGGVLVVSTPNIYCPGRFLRDATHVTPFAWDELGGCLLLTGYELEGIYRVVPGSVARRAGQAILKPLARALGVDTAPSVAAVGKNGEPVSSPDLCQTSPDSV